VSANNSFKPTPHRGICHVLYATLARVRHPAAGRLNSGVKAKQNAHIYFSSPGARNISSDDEISETTKNSLGVAGSLADHELSKSTNKIVRASGKSGVGSMIAAIPGAIDKANEKINEQEMQRIQDALLKKQELLSRNEKIESEIKNKILADVFLSQTDGLATDTTKDGIYLSHQDSAKFIAFVMACGSFDKDLKNLSRLTTTMACGEKSLSNGIRVVGNPYRRNVYIIRENYYAIASYEK
jgi:hypothetical protein